MNIFDETSFSRVSLGIFSALFLAVATAIFFFYLMQKENLKQELQSQVLGIGTLKVNQINAWLEQYQRDGLLLKNGAMLSANINAWLQSARYPEAFPVQVARQLALRKAIMNYRDIFVLSPEGAIHYATGEEKRERLDEDTRELVQKAVASREIHFSSIQRDSRGRDGIHLEMAVPLLSEGEPSSQVSSVIVFYIDVRRFLFPLLQSWPSPSTSAETLLVAREGDHVVFLNQLRHYAGGALTLKLPVTRESQTPAVRGVLGETGIMEGVDYRGVPVLAATIPVGRMAWVMVSKIDQDEVYAPLRLQAWTFLLTLLLTLLLSLVLLRLRWVDNTKHLIEKGMDRLNLSQHIARVGSWDWDPYPDREIWSTELFQILGLDPLLVPCNRVVFQQQVHPEDRQRIMWEFYESLERDALFHREYRIVRPDGQVRFILEKGSFFRNREGKVHRVVGVVLDLTERKLVEGQMRQRTEQLEKSNRAYRALSRTNHAVYHAQDEKGLLQEACDVVQQECGYQMVWIGLVVHDEARSVRAVAQAGFDDGYLEKITVSWADDAYGQGPTGLAIRTGRTVINQDSLNNPLFAPWRQEAIRRGYASSAAFPMVNDGVCLGCLAVYASRPHAFAEEEARLLEELATNVAHGLLLLRLQVQRQRNEEELRRKQTHLQGIFDTSNAAIFQLDLQARVVIANRAMAEMFGYEPGELPGMCYLDLLHPDCRGIAVKKLEDGSERVNAERLYQRKDGQSFWGYLSGQRLRENGRDVSLIGIISDISERKQAEELLKAAKAEADKANQAKDLFLANMSHEVRTPLNAILNLTFLAQQSTQDATQRGYLKKVQDAAGTLSLIINDILDFSKIEAGKLELEKVPFHLDEVLHNIFTILEVTNRKKLAVAFQTTGDVPPLLLGDPLRLGQVLLNLLSNAVKFTDQGQVSLDVAVLERSGERVVLRFVVTDTGCGITGEQMQRLFQPFQQGDASIARRFGGTGLGLVISQRLVALMAGVFQATSQPGQGSTFSFTIPLGWSAAPPSPPQERLPVSEALAGEVAGARILVVEDMEVNQQIARGLLERQGCVVTMADHGQQAIELVACHSFDLIFMDLQMPGMDGFETTRRLRGNPAMVAVPIIAMTAHAFESDRQNCLKAGMNDHLPKPINPQHLQQVLQRWLPALQRPELSSPVQGVGGALALPTLPGFDVVAGLANVIDNLVLYRILLKKFAQSNRETLARVHHALAHGESGAARALVHGVAGVAGNLGAKSLMTAARDLEKLLLVPETAAGVLLAQFAIFQGCMMEALAAVQQLTVVVPQGGVVAVPVESREEVRQILQKLAVLLVARDVVEAMHWAGVLCGLLRDPGQIAATELLMEQLFGFQWEEAVATLAGIAAGQEG